MAAPLLRRGRTTTAAALLALLLAAAAPARAYPQKWSSTLNAATCIDHPTSLVSHTTPRTDPGVTFAVKLGGAAVATPLCPGTTYSLEVTFPGNHHYFVTANVPKALSGTVPTGCAGSRVVAGTNSQKTKLTTNLAIPATGGYSSIFIKSSSSIGTSAPILQNSVTLPIGTAGVAPCTGSPPPPPPPPPPPTPPPPGPTPPPPTPPPPTPPPPGPTPPSGVVCPSAGACAVCASTTRCAACVSPGYVLNLATGRCDCAPGYSGKTSSSSRGGGEREDRSSSSRSSSVREAQRLAAQGRLPVSEDGQTLSVASAAAKLAEAASNGNTFLKCSRCDAESASPGGATAAGSKCVKCAKGSAPNVDRSACIPTGSWPMWSLDTTNRRWNGLETKLTPATVGGLVERWAYAADGDVSATPTLYAGALYFPTWKGVVVSLNATTGAVRWTKKVVDLLRSAGVAVAAADEANVVSRTAPAFSASGDRFVIGTMMRNIGGYPYLLGISAKDGKVLYATKLDDNPAALVTMSASVWDKYAFVGTSSLEEARAGAIEYKCCSFRGSLSKVDLTTGRVLYKTYTAPEGRGWSGAAAWGSMPSVDASRRLVLFATGDNYDYPPEVEQCLKDLGPLTNENAPQQAACERLAGGDQNYRNAIVALDLDKMTVRWATKLGGPDAWNAACFQPNHPNCPAASGPDWDFGQAPMLVTACRNGLGCKLLAVAAAKSGVAFALDVDSGSVVWTRQVGPAGVLGGSMWGSASDNERVYVAINNAFHAPLAPFIPGSTNNGGMVAALDAWDGSVVWTFANPEKQIDNDEQNALSIAPVTVAGGVVYYSSMDATGKLFMLSAKTGAALSSYAMGASDACGPSVVNSAIFSGSGYSTFGQGNTGTKVTALGLPGKGWCPACPKGCEDNGKCRT